METNNGKQGGLLKGDRHSAPSGGIKAVVVTDDNRPVLLEDNEVIINRKSVADPEVKTLTGTNKEILSQINQEHGGVAIMEKGGDITYEKAHGGAIESLQDVGEKIGGAKKDLVKQLSEVTSSDLEKQPLSKSFPEPDYTKMYKDGTITQEGAILIKFLYDHLPAKPRKSYRIAGWVATVQAAIDVVRQVIESESTKNIDFTTRIINIRSTIDSRFSRDYKIFSETMKGLGFPETNVKLGNFEIRVFSRYIGKPVLGTEGSYEKETRPIEQTYAIIEGNTVVKDFTSMDDAISGLRELLSKGKSKVTKFDVYQDRRTKDFFIGKKGAHDVIHVMDGFKSAKEAFTFVKDNRPELQAIWDGMKANVEERRSVNRERIGVDWRKGANISSEAFASKFGFRGVEFGNWVNPSERQSHVNEAYDALMDLSAITGIVPSGLSLNGEMGFAFGARGSGRANAHYEPGKVVINLTKTRGAGSLGHEWWHAVDNYFSRKRGVKAGFITESPKQLTTTTEIDETVERKEMIDAFAGIMEAISKTNLRNRAMSLDRTRSEAYWSTPIEMSARCFENYIINKLGETDYVNDYLANFKEVSEWINDTKGSLEIENNYPYPLADEEGSINEAYKYFFETVQQRVDDGKTALFEKGGSLNNTNNNNMGNRDRDIYIGKMITDELSTKKYYISNIDAKGIELVEAHAIGTSDVKKHIGFHELLDKFTTGSITIDGYIKDINDIEYLSEKLEKIRMSFDNYELGAKLDNIEKKKREDEENRKKRDRFALGTQLEDDEKELDKRIREAYAKLDEKTANWIQENAPDEWKNSSLDDIPDEVFSVAQLRQKQVLMDEYDVVMDMGNGGDVTNESRNWLVTAIDRTAGGRRAISIPLTYAQAEASINRYNEQYKNALPQYIFLSDFRIEPMGGKYEHGAVFKNDAWVLNENDTNNKSYNPFSIPIYQKGDSVKIYFRDVEPIWIDQNKKRNSLNLEAQKLKQEYELLNKKKQPKKVSDRIELMNNTFLAKEKYQRKLSEAESLIPTVWFIAPRGFSNITTDDEVLLPISEAQDTLVKKHFKEIYKYEHGGSIPNNYEGKSPEWIWNHWKQEQRAHFCGDHGIELSAEQLSWDEFSKDPDNVFKLSQHLEMGAYEDGGNTSEPQRVGSISCGDDYDFKIYKLGEKFYVSEKAHGKLSSDFNEKQSANGFIDGYDDAVNGAPAPKYVKGKFHLIKLNDNIRIRTDKKEVADAYMEGYQKGKSLKSVVLEKGGKLSSIQRKLKSKGVEFYDFDEDGLGINAKYNGHPIEEYNYEVDGKSKRLPQDVIDLIDEYNSEYGEAFAQGGSIHDWEINPDFVTEEVYWALYELDRRLVDTQITIKKAKDGAFDLTTEEGFKINIEKQKTGTNERIVYDWLKQTTKNKIGIYGNGGGIGKNTEYYIVKDINDGKPGETIYRSKTFNKDELQKKFDEEAKKLNVGETLEYGKEDDYEFSPNMLLVEMKKSGLVVYTNSGRTKKYTPKFAKGAFLQKLFSKKPKAKAQEYKLHVKRPDGSTDDLIFPTKESAETSKKSYEGLGYTGTITEVHEKGGNIGTYNQVILRDNGNSWLGDTGKFMSNKDFQSEIKSLLKKKKSFLEKPNGNRYWVYELVDNKPVLRAGQSKQSTIDKYYKSDRIVVHFEESFFAKGGKINQQEKKQK